MVFYVSESELVETHQSIGHGGRDCMIKELSHKYKNVMCSDIAMYIHVCEPGQQRWKESKKGVS